MEQFEKGNMISAGKTKEIYEVKGNPTLVIIQNKDDITKFDDPDQTRIMNSKAFHATKTTCLVFQLLKEAGLPVAFKKQLSPTEFLAPKCQMIPLEVIIRRYAVGSYLKRFPNLERSGNPWRFHRLIFELFFKTTSGRILNDKSEVVRSLPDDILETAKGKSVDDPFIINPYGDAIGGFWELKHPKIPSWNKSSNLDTDNSPLRIFAPDFMPRNVKVVDIEVITRKVFMVLESAWAMLGFRLMDFKIEFGVGEDGTLYVADVIDNDSWRLRTQDWREVSKQLFRDNYDMAEIEEKYALVSKLTERFAIPEQAIVFWRGSELDILPPVDNLPKGIKTEDIVLSGHKSPQACLNKLEEVLAAYPEGGVFIPIVGMSNGLAPTLAARTSWPVITVPARADKDHHDVWSCLSVPSSVPLMTVMSAKNAVLAAINILAQKNPAAYMDRQYALEGLDIPK